MRWTLCKATQGTLQNEEMVILGRWVGCPWTQADLLRYITGGAK